MRHYTHNITQALTHCTLTDIQGEFGGYPVSFKRRPVVTMKDRKINEIIPFYGAARLKHLDAYSAISHAVITEDTTDYQVSLMPYNTVKLNEMIYRA